MIRKINKLADYILLTTENLKVLFEEDGNTFLRYIEQIEIDIEKKIEDPGRGRDMAMRFIRNKMREQKIVPIFDSKLEQQPTIPGKGYNGENYDYR